MFFFFTNISNSTSQLPNNPNRFKGDKVNKMVMASIKDADAMLFHIYATAAKSRRNINNEEKQQIVDINSGKMRLMAQLYSENNPPMPLSPNHSLEEDVVIMPNKYGKWLVYEYGGGSGGEPIDEFGSKEEALMNYPEGEIKNA